MGWKGNIIEKQDRIQVILEDVFIDQSVISDAMLSSTKPKVIDKIFEEHEPFLHHNKKDTYMYSVIPDGFGVCEETYRIYLVTLTRKWLYDLLFEKAQNINFKCTIGATHTHTGKYLWDEDDTPEEITSEKWLNCRYMWQPVYSGNKSEPYLREKFGICIGEWTRYIFY